MRSTTEGDLVPRDGSPGRTIPVNQPGEMIGNSLPPEVIADCHYLAGLTADQLADMARAAILVDHCVRVTGITPDNAAVRYARALVDVRRMRPSTIRSFCESVGAPPHIYDEFLRLCPGAIAPERHGHD